MANNLNLKRKSSGWVEGSCPFCKKDRKAVLQFNPEGEYFHCFRCGMKGSRLEFEAMTGIILDFDFANYVKKDFMVEEFDFNSEDGVPIYSNEAAFTYLKKRGALSYALLNKWKYTYHKVRIPIMHNNVCVGMMDNNLAANSTLRYIFTTNTKPSSIFFNYDAAKFKSTVVLVEGVYDAISVHNAMPTMGALGLFGKFLSDNKIRLLSKLNIKEAIILLDSPEKDKDIKKSVKLIAARLGPVVPVSVATLDHGDPNDASSIEIQKAIYNREGV